MYTASLESHFLHISLPSVTAGSPSTMESPLSASAAGEGTSKPPHEVPGRRVTTFHLYDPKVAAGSLLAGLTLSPCQLNTDVGQVVEGPDTKATRRPGGSARSGTGRGSVP